MINYIIEKKKAIFFELPFYWKPLVKGEIDIFPPTLPFELVFDEGTGVLIQNNNQNKSILKKTYRLGSEITGLMDEKGIGLHYANDYLFFLEKNMIFGTDKGMDVLEIGCGTGYFLNLIKEKCNSALGIEPGFNALGKYSVDVINDFFPCKKILNRKFDLIIAYGVLEHIPKSDNLLQEMKKYLTDEGKIAIAVPDCTESIENGDISMLIHEHYSYFNMDSLESYLLTNGFKIEIMDKSKYGGSIYCILKNSNKTQKKITNTDYFNKLDKNINNFKAFLTNCKFKSIGIYVPTRAVNLIYLFSNVIKKSNIAIRFFDDSERLRNKFLPCFDIPIENSENLKKNPPEYILIYSYSFGQKIKRKLEELNLGCEIRTISEIIQNIGQKNDIFQ